MEESVLQPLSRAARVVVGVTGSARSGAALRRAAQEARRTGSVLVPVLAWEPPGGEAAYRLAPVPSLAAIWERQAGERLSANIAAALGAVPEGIRVEPVVARAPASYALTKLADQPGDLLVLSAGPRNPLVRLLRGAVRRRVAARARANLLLVAAPAVPRSRRLPRSARRELRRITPDDFLRPSG